MAKRDITIGILLVLLLALTVSSVFAAAYSPKLTADIWIGGDSAPEELIVFNGELIFSADDGASGRELWSYDGTTASIIADINPAGSSDPSDLAIYNGDMYFRADDGTGSDLWVYDGINPPTVIPAAPSATYSYPEGMTVYNGNLYFSAEFFSNPTDYGTELLVFDGTTISLAADINPTGDSTPYSLEVYAGQLFFAADNGSDGFELWSYDDGTGTATQAADVHPTGSSLPDELVVYSGKLFFSADGGIDGFELWQYDDATGVASQAADIFTGPTSSYPYSMTVYNGKLYLAARASDDYYELFEYDGVTGIAMRAGVIGPDEEYSYPDWLTVFDGKLYFAAYNWPEGYEVFTFDGTNYALGADITPDSSSSKPRYFAVRGDVLYLQANDGTTGAELWEISDLAGPTVVSTNLEPLMARDISQITITFDEDVYDPPGSSDANDVTNPANYLLVNLGVNNTLDTTSCSAAAGDDTPIAVNAVTYDNSTFTATLGINGGAPLPLGRYTLFVCGAGQNAIIDPLGNPLNGGADEIISFEIVRELLPDTGFAPGVKSALAGKSILKSYTDLWLEVPSLGLEMDILGVPKTPAGWDVSWLGSNAGWLEGSAFPTWSGNTVITGHVWNADGYPGPFINLKSLRHGDMIKVHAWGQVYTYEVQVSRLLWATQTQVTFQHESYDWLTLLTCENWDSSQDEYRNRRLVRAVLVDISPE